MLLIAMKVLSVIDADALYALGHVGSVDKDALRDGQVESIYKVQKKSTILRDDTSFR